MSGYREPSGRRNYKNVPPLEPVPGSGLEIVYGTPPTSVLRGIKGSSGPSSERPSDPVTGSAYFDEDLGYPIYYDGTVWRASYNELNSLGTVSQSGGIPTGALMEYGSNLNGEYWRYAGGMMTCISPLLLMDLDTIVTPLYRGATNWTYPSSFINSDTFVSSSVGVGAGTWGGNVGNITTTTCILRAYSTTSRTGDTVKGLAVGRWF